MRGFRSFAAASLSHAAGIAALLTLFSAGQALACRGGWHWPDNPDDPRIEPGESVVRASLLRAYESKNEIRPIMGSDIDMIYRVKIIDVISNPEKNISVNGEINIENNGQVCEFYRPWTSSNARDVRNSEPKILIISKESGQWRTRGGN